MSKSKNTVNKEEGTVTVVQSEETLDNTVAPIKETDTFVFMEDVKRILSASLKTEKNIILYGPGGYGKSEFTEAFLREAGITPYVITMGSGMTTDRLFGGLDIPTFNGTGKIEYLVENSFMANEYVIFEELFDAPDFILEQLKDILSSGIFRNGGQNYEIKTKTIICCTNKTREEFSKNNSLKALMERFPLEQKVVWKDHNRITYEALLKSKMGFADPMLTYILEEYAKAGNVISPRIAICAAEMIKDCGPDSLMFIADFNLKPDLLKTSVSKFKSIAEISKKMEIMDKIAQQLATFSFAKVEEIKEGAKLNKQLLTKVAELKAIKADDSLVGTTTAAIKKYTEVHNLIKRKLDAIMAMDDSATEAFDTSSITSDGV